MKEMRELEVNEQDEVKSQATSESSASMSVAIIAQKQSAVRGSLIIAVFCIYISSSDSAPDQREGVCQCSG